MRFLWVMLIAGFVLFSLVPTGYELMRQGDIQPDRQFELVHNFYTDFNFYLSRIRQGLDGRWTVVERYTTEAHEGSFIHEMYLLMGQVGRFVRVPWWRASDIYHVARVVLAVTLLSLVSVFVQKQFPGKGGWQVVALLLAMTASSWPKLTAVVSNTIVPVTLQNWQAWRLGGYMPWWSLMDSLQRITFIPHILAGQALIVFLVFALVPMQSYSGWSLVFLGFLAFLLGMIFPPGYLFAGGVVFVGIVIASVWEKRVRWGDLFSAGLVFVIGFPSLLYLLLMTSIYPWKRLAELDVIHPLPFSYTEYALALGPTLVLGLVGLFFVLRHKDHKLLPSASWVIAWLLFLGIFRFIPQQSPLRFSEMLPHVALGILTAYFFLRLRVLGYLRYLSVMVLLLLGLFQMYSSWLWQKDFIDQKISATVPLVPTGSYVMYPLKDFYTGIIYIRDHSKPSDIVLSESTAGNYIPALSGNRVFIGHDNTVNAEQKKHDVALFFSGGMDQRTALAFLRTVGATFVYVGPQEFEEAKGKALQSYYPFLVPVYTTPMVTVYTAP